LHAPWLLPESGTLTAIACAVCTLGPAFEQRISELFAGRQASLAMALDELGNELLFAVSRRAQDRMLADAARRRDCAWRANFDPAIRGLRSTPRQRCCAWRRRRTSASASAAAA
jgi:hypothetical protein